MSQNQGVAIIVQNCWSWELLGLIGVSGCFKRRFLALTLALFGANSEES
jgi:hypothetical protein